MTVVDVCTGNRFMKDCLRGQVTWLPGEDYRMGNGANDTGEPPSQWLTIQEVAERLRYSTRTIHRYVNQGHFGPVLRGSSHSLRISIEAVEQFERDHLGK